MTAMEVSEVIGLANRHLGGGTMKTSASLCLREASRLFDRGQLVAAKERALKSLAYSVGILHPDYRRALGQ